MTQKTAPHSANSLVCRIKFFLVLVTSVVLFVLVGVHFTGFTLPLVSQLLTANSTRDLITSHSVMPSHAFSREVASSSSSQCNDVLTNMVNGRWHPRRMTPDEVKEMRRFQRRVEKDHNLPKSNQRADKLCGNVSAGTSKKHQWFTALCDPDGPTPCCYNHVCQNKTREQCTCPNCLDMRTVIHSEYATWCPYNRSCQFRKWSVSAICRLLHNSTLLFIGDSLVRHVYTALLLDARGNFQTGAFKRNTSEELRSECSGLTMFSEKVCRHTLDTSTTLCDGSVKVRYSGVTYLNEAKNVHKAILNLGNRSRSVVVMMVGLHDGLPTRRVKDQLLKPVLQTMRSRRLTSPLLVWAAVHQFGVMKAPSVTTNKTVARSFNRDLQDFPDRYDVPVFDTYNLTHGVFSFDGTHFGYGVNSLKVSILLHYLQELRSRGKW